MKKTFSASLAAEMGILTVAALIASVLLYFILSFAGELLLDNIFDNEKYYHQQDEKMLANLSKYAASNNVNSDDWYALNKWVEREDVVSLVIYKGGELTYDSQLDVYYEAETDASESSSMNSVIMIESDFERNKSYHVEFADGEADVLIYGKYSTDYYNIAYVLEFVIPCVFFMLIIMAAVSKKIQYLVQLSKEIYMIEGGDLESPITIKGRDEIAMLASSVDSLRKSFIQKLARIMQLQDESKALVTEMSHDLRTPMTPLMIYLGMLREKRYENEDERDSYVEKSYEKAAQLKHMSDNMFSYFLMDKNADIHLESLSMHDAFYDQLSSMKGYLTLEGYQIQINMNMDDVNIMINADFMIRIFDNLVSNILKYADCERAVIINLFSENGKVILHISNRINELADHSTSTGFGVKNIKKMMQQMSSECIIHQKDDRYDTFLLFRITSVME